MDMTMWSSGSDFQAYEGGTDGSLIYNSHDSQIIYMICMRIVQMIYV